MWHKSLLILLLSLSGNVWAGVNDVLVNQVWVGESIPGQNSATLEMTVTTVQAAKLLSISTDAAEKVEIHSVSQQWGKMKSNVAQSINLPAHHNTAFGSHQLFVILVGLKRQLEVDDTIQVKLDFEYADHRKQTIDVQAPVKKMALSYKHLGSGEVHDHR